jgi:hypothetical protein
VAGFKKKSPGNDAVALLNRPLFNFFTGQNMMTSSVMAIATLTTISRSIILSFPIFNFLLAFMLLLYRVMLL